MGRVDFFSPEASISWRPSPCGRLSRPPTTMTPPTLLTVIGRLLALSFHQEPLTFRQVDSSGGLGGGLRNNPSRSLRNPERGQGKSGDLPLPLDWVCPLSSLGGPFGPVRRLANLGL